MHPVAGLVSIVIVLILGLSVQYSMESNENFQSDSLDELIMLIENYRRLAIISPEQIAYQSDLRQKIRDLKATLAL